MTRGRPSQFALAHLACGIAIVSVVGLAAATGPALAQGSSANAASEEITISGPNYIERRVPLPARRFELVNPQRVTLSRRVSYHDLNLSQPSGAIELEHRINATARDVCRELRQRSPRSLFQVVQSDDCVRSAVNGGMAQARQIVATASRLGMAGPGFRPPG